MLRSARKMTRRKIYEGEVQVYRQVPAMVELSNFAHEMIADFLSVKTTDDILASKAFRDPRKIEEVCRAFEKNERVNRYFKEAMRSLGQGGAYTFVDRVRLRVQPSSQGRNVLRREGTFSSDLVRAEHAKAHRPQRAEAG